jgi:hypothetical protein
MIVDFRLWLLFVEHDLNPAQYNALFDKELEMLLPRISNPTERNRLQGMLGNGWTNYIAASLRHAGFYDQASIQEKIHDITVKLLVSPSGLFRNYDETRHGPFDLRWKRSVANAIKNMTEKERNRRRFIPSVSIHQKFGVTDLPGRMSEDDQMIQDFRHLVQNRLGQLGVAVLDARLADEETKSLVGRPDLGSPNLYAIKQAVKEIKTLAQQFASSLGDPAFLRDIERAMGREQETISKRRATMRQGR